MGGRRLKTPQFPPSIPQSGWTPGKEGLLVDQRLFTPADQPEVQLVIVTGQQMLVMPARSRPGVLLPHLAGAIVEEAISAILDLGGAFVVPGYRISRANQFVLGFLPGRALPSAGHSCPAWQLSCDRHPPNTAIGWVLPGAQETCNSSQCINACKHAFVVGQW